MSKGDGMKKIQCAFVVAGLMASSLAIADEDNAAKHVFTLGEIEVTGTAESARNITVDRVYEDEFREFNRDTISDAVNLLPGVTLSKVGARNESMVYVRGLDVKHVPLFLDGIPIYVPYDGYPDYSRFFTFDLSEIIVSKGFTSVLYGPNSMGGAINMVSRRPEKAFEGSLGAGYSTGHAYETYANLGTNQKKWYLQAGGSYVDSDYFRLSDDFKAVATEDGGKRTNSYHHDGKINIKAGFTPNKDDEYAIGYIYQHGVKGTPPYAGTDPSQVVRYWQWPYWDKESCYFTSKTEFGDKKYIKSRLYYDTFENSLYSYDDATYSTITKKYAFKSWYDDYTYGGSLEGGTGFFDGNILKAAFHYKTDVHREHNKGEPIRRFEDEIFSLGIEDTWDITDKIYIITGISYDILNTEEAQDYNSKTQKVSSFPTDDSSAWNPQLGLFYKTSETGRVHASIARKTRFATMKDKYSYKLGTALPNPGLDPETSLNYEVGYDDLIFDKIRLKTAVFYNDFKDFILFAVVPDPSNPQKTLNQNQNIGKVKNYGFEIGLTAEILDKLEGGFNYTYLQWDNDSNPDKLTNLPEHKIFSYLKYMPLKAITLLGSLEYDSERYSSSDGRRVAGAFTVFNAKAAYEIIRDLSVEFNVSNVFDKDYAIDEGYSEPGRTCSLNMRYEF